MMTAVFIKIKSIVPMKNTEKEQTQTEESNNKKADSKKQQKKKEKKTENTKEDTTEQTQEEGTKTVNRRMLMIAVRNRAGSAKNKGTG